MKKYFPILFILIFILPAIRPLFHSGFFTMHDDQQVVRLAELDRALTAGQFPVRFVGDLGFGYGYPLFNFYPPLVYYLGEIFHLLGFSYLLSIKLVFVTAFLGAALTMYWWAHHHFGTWPAVIAALFYTYVPYHAVDAYVRGALAELFAFVWLPLILLSVDILLSRIAPGSDSPGRKKSQRTSVLEKIKPLLLSSNMERHNNAPGSQTPGRDIRRWGIVLSLSYAALMLTHNLIFLPFSLLLGLYLAIRLVTQPTSSSSKLKSFLIISSSLFIGFGLTTFFWLPALAEKQFTLVDSILLSEKYTYSLHYVKPWQLWNSLWGYGGSAPPEDIDGFTLKIGKLHTVLASLAFLLAATVKFYSKRFKKIPTQFALYSILYTLFLTSAFLTTNYSSFIWDHFQPLQYLQFPWRFLTFTALFSSFLVAGFCHQISKIISKPSILYTLYSILIFLLFFPNLKLFQPQTYLDVGDNYYLSDKFMKWKISGTSFEFVPKGVATHLDPGKNITQLNITEDQIAITPYTVIAGNPQVSTITNSPHLKRLQLNSATSSILELNTFNFPIWKATIDNLPISINDNNPLKLVQVSVPPGNHLLTVKFTNTPTRTFANLTSLSFLLLLSGLLVIKKYQLARIHYGR